MLTGRLRAKPHPKQSIFSATSWPPGATDASLGSVFQLSTIQFASRIINRGPFGCKSACNVPAEFLRICLPSWNTIMRQYTTKAKWFFFLWWCQAGFEVMKGKVCIWMGALYHRTQGSIFCTISIIGNFFNGMSPLTGKPGHFPCKVPGCVQPLHLDSLETQWGEWAHIFNRFWQHSVSNVLLIKNYNWS